MMCRTYKFLLIQLAQYSLVLHGWHISRSFSSSCRPQGIPILSFLHILALVEALELPGRYKVI